MTSYFIVLDQSLIAMILAIYCVLDTAHFLALFFVLQPQNILLSKDGSNPESMIKLVDFGLSKYISAGLEIREILGTPDYVGEYRIFCPVQKPNSNALWVVA